ncbi:hypothetical protein [Streptomyces sp. Y1]|uniref:Protein kinase domain-containing protein n=1 Tax=Streptomyces sp. Y1 TaxID=3238634 RepID=A0AB39TN90_9ACTN
MTAIRVERLTRGDKLGQGGQGTVWDLPGRLINGEWPMAYKEYSAACRGELDGPALDAMVEFVPGLADAAGRWLCERLAWPAAVVLDDRGRCGILMRLVPDDFFLTSPHTGRTLAGFQFLLNNEGYLNRVGIAISDEQRLQLLLDLSRTLAGLHRLGVVVGDLSPKNVLFRLGAEPGCFLIDCDAMRVRGRDALKQAETPDWSLPEGEPQATERGDAYKFGLLVVRLLAGEQDGRDTGVVAALSPDLGRLADAALGSDPAGRPEPAAWEGPLLRAIRDLRTPPAGPDGPDWTIAPPSPPGASGQSGTPGPSTPDSPPGPGKVLAGLLLAVVLVWGGVQGVSALKDHADADRSTPSSRTPYSTPYATPYRPPTGGTGGGGTTGGGVVPPDPGAQARALDVLLGSSSSTRTAISGAVDDVGSCGNVSYDAQVLRGAAGDRNALVTRLQNLDTSALPAVLSAQLQQAWKSSALADQAFARWADTQVGCTGTANPDTPEHDEASRQSDAATAAKKAFVNAWNPIAARYGLAQREETGI